MIQVIHNDLTVIVNGLFEYNLRLSGIDLSHNKIRVVSMKVFDHLKSLRYVYLDGNPLLSTGNFDSLNFNCKYLKSQVDQIQTSMNSQNQKFWSLSAKVEAVLNEVTKGTVVDGPKDFNSLARMIIEHKKELLELKQKVGSVPVPMMESEGMLQLESVHASIRNLYLFLVPLLVLLLPVNVIYLWNFVRNLKFSASPTDPTEGMEMSSSGSNLNEYSEPSTPFGQFQGEFVYENQPRMLQNGSGSLSGEVVRICRKSDQSKNEKVYDQIKPGLLEVILWEANKGSFIGGKQLSGNFFLLKLAGKSGQKVGKNGIKWAKVRKKKLENFALSCFPLARVLMTKKKIQFFGDVISEWPPNIYFFFIFSIQHFWSLKVLTVFNI